MKKMNNKGFSLVELIIVIAIMAILLVVLAPQYLKYVERSRNSTDLQNAAEIVTALQIYASDPEALVVPAAGSITIGNAAITPTAGSFEAAALADAGLMNGAQLETRCQSRTAWDGYTISWALGTGVNTGQLIFTYSSTVGGAAANPDTFATRMAGGH